VPREQWQVVVRDAHVGYISWEAYEMHLTQLAANSQAYTPQRLRPPREGPALLQGVVLCGRCGERMTVRDHQRGGHRIVPDDLCQRAGIARGEPPCQRVPGRDLERAIANVLVEVVTPETVALTLAVQDELVARAAEAARLRQLQVERAQYEADLAQRRYLRVDPENRLVADVLEAEWNAKLRALAEAREAAAQPHQQDQARLSATERETMMALPQEFTRFWPDPRTTERERQRVVRLLIEDVTVQKTDHSLAQIRFKGGATRPLTVPLPPSFTQSRLTPPHTLTAIDRLLDTSTDAEVAAQLNAQEYRTFAGLPFQATHVSQLRRAHGLKDRLTRLRDAGMRTAAEVAAHLGVSEQTVWRWYHRGWITGARYNDRGTCVFVPPETVPPRRRRQRVGTLNRP
jgi:recombinase-like zinc beta ribbon protein/Homeodomain-like domain-containing protein